MTERDPDGATQAGEKEAPFDFLTVTKELERQSRLAEIGGPAYLTTLINTVPTSLHAEAYGRIVETAATRRRILAAANEIARVAHQENLLIDTVINTAEKAIFEISARRLTRPGLGIGSVVSTVYDQVDAASRGEGEAGLPTGFLDLDQLPGGLQPSDLVIVAGRGWARPASCSPWPAIWPGGIKSPWPCSRWRCPMSNLSSACSPRKRGSMPSGCAPDNSKTPSGPCLSRPPGRWAPGRCFWTTPRR